MEGPSCYCRFRLPAWLYSRAGGILIALLLVAIGVGLPAEAASTNRTTAPGDTGQLSDAHAPIRSVCTREASGSGTGETSCSPPTVTLMLDYHTAAYRKDSGGPWWLQNVNFGAQAGDGLRAITHFVTTNRSSVTSAGSWGRRTTSGLWRNFVKPCPGVHFVRSGERPDFCGCLRLAIFVVAARPWKIPRRTGATSRIRNCASPNASGCYILTGYESSSPPSGGAGSSAGSSGGTPVPLPPKVPVCGVTIAVGSTIQAAIDANPPGTVLCLPAGPRTQ